MAKARADCFPPLPEGNSGGQVAEDLRSIVGFMLLDHDHLIFRKFEKLSTYNLLFQQHQLAVVDSELAECERRKNYEKIASILPSIGPLLRDYGTISV